MIKQFKAAYLLVGVDRTRAVSKVVRSTAFVCVNVAMYLEVE